MCHRTTNEHVISMYIIACTVKHQMNLNLKNFDFIYLRSYHGAENHTQVLHVSIGCEDQVLVLKSFGKTRQNHGENLPMSFLIRIKKKKCW